MLNNRTYQIVCVDVMRVAVAQWIARIVDRFVTKQCILEHVVDCVHPKPGRSTLHPEAQDIIELLDHLRVAIVQIRLAHFELMQIVLLAYFAPLPSRTIKHGVL